MTFFRQWTTYILLLVILQYMVAKGLYGIYYKGKYYCVYQEGHAYLLHMGYKLVNEIALHNAVTQRGNSNAFPAPPPIHINMPRTSQKMIEKPISHVKPHFESTRVSYINQKWCSVCDGGEKPIDGLSSDGLEYISWEINPAECMWYH